MKDLEQFDRFMIMVLERINEQPSRRARIIRDAVQQSGCPYLKEKLEGNTEKKLGRLIHEI